MVATLQNVSISLNNGSQRTHNVQNKILENENLSLLKCLVKKIFLLTGI